MGFKQWSMSRKLGAMSAFQIGMLLVVGTVEYMGAKATEKYMHHLVDNQIPASRHMTLANMMCDGMRAVVFRSLYLFDHGSAADRQEVKDVIKEFADNFKTYIAEIQKLDLTADIAKEVEEIKPLVKEYADSAVELVGLVVGGPKAGWENKIDPFQELFTKLEDGIGSLGKKITKTSEGAGAVAIQEAESMNFWSGVLVICGFLFGTLASIWVVRGLVSHLALVIEQLEQSSREVMNASSQTADTASRLSEGATAQASNLQETMASVEQISAMVNQNAESAANAKSAVESNQEMSDEGTRSVGQVIGAMNEIKKTNDDVLTQIETSNKEFANVVRIISEIGEKTKVINDIVFQTKILSFNASVEAARAGEHGKGFSVVAEEVGNLAQMSGNAAKEITDMLTNSIKKVNEIVETTSTRVDQLVEVGKDKISMGQSMAESCRAVLEKVSSNAASISAMVAEIAHASREQAQGLLEINKAIGQLDQATQQTSEEATKSSSQAENLNSESSALTESVNSMIQFVRGAGAQSAPEPRRKVVASAPKKAKSAGQSTKVVSLQSHKEKAASKASHSGTAVASAKAKMAVGANTVPAADDPSFKEF